MTPLDTAVKEARKSEEARREFYNIFLRSELYIPVQSEFEGEGRQRIKEKTQILPILAEARGVKHVMLFDSQQRLSEWAPQGLKFIGCTGHAIVGMADPEVPWFMNVGSEFSKVFVTEEVRWLKQYLTKVQQAATKETKVIPAGATVKVSAPVKPSEKFAQALKDCLERNQEIERAFLGSIQYEDDGIPPHLTFVLRRNRRRNSRLLMQ